MPTTVIIGANFGDEGKGNLTDFHVKPGSMVVRFNGGAQCSHTVVRNGKRHIFRHFGAGSLQGAPTFLSRFFVNNPILYFKELELLEQIGIEPEVFVDPNGLLTTPWDMMLNQIVEEHRGVTRHGSCGVGINETHQRQIWFPLFVSDHHKREICFSIMKEWVTTRLDMLGIEPSPEWKQRLESMDIFDRFMEHMDAYFRSTSMMYMEDSMKQSKTSHLVFEGGQGLLLDQAHYFFPHVTHSNTGAKNPSILLSEANIRDIEVVYVTRPYLHRHGAGPFPKEDPSVAYKDDTNIPNDWQGAMRFGHLDLDLLAESIRHDQTFWRQDVETKLAITCLDQMPESIRFWQHEAQSTLSKNEFISHVCAQIGVKTCFLGYGPDATNILVAAV